MTPPVINYLDVSEETVNNYIQSYGLGGVYIIDNRSYFKILPDGKKTMRGRIPYQNGWLKVEIQYHVDGKLNTSFGIYGMQALESKKKLL